MNNQRFPVQLRSYVDLIGADKETTILDMERESSAFLAHSTPESIFPGDNNTFYTRLKITDFTITNGSNLSAFAGKGALRLESCTSITLENIDIANCRTGDPGKNIPGSETIAFTASRDVIMRNVSIYNSSGRHALSVSTSDGRPPLKFYAENIRIRRHEPTEYSIDSPETGTGGGVIIRSVSGSSNGVPSPFDVTLVNLELTDNVIGSIPSWYGDTYESFLYGGGKLGSFRIINTTLGNNNSTSSHGAEVRLAGSLNFEIVNSIVQGNSPYQLSIVNSFDQSGSLKVSHSLIRGGREEMFGTGFANIDVHWDDSNIDADPLWVGEDVNPDYPYMLAKNSPARGAGTLDIPDFEFPEYDLAGNPRIVDGRIDMGAYQWHPVQMSIEEDVGTGYHTVRPDFNLRNFPNPAVTLLNHRTVGVDGYRSSTTGTNIAFELPEAGEVMIEIYNLKGQFVKRIFDAYIPKGEHNVFWDGRDERGRYVATGFYMYNLHINNQLAATGRATFIK